MNVREAFLDHPKNHEFQFLRQTFQMLGQFQPDVDVALFPETFDVPAQSGLQSHFVQQRRMKQIRRRAQLF